MKLDWLKPGVSKPWLYLLAGLMWATVGIVLNRYSYQWLKGYPWSEVLIWVIGGVILALTIYKFGFSKFSKKNIQRIENIKSEKPCIFAFQQWTSYPLIAVMISMGIYLRIYSPFPKPLLAAAYIGIGGSLFLASFQYFIKIFTILKKQ